MGGWILQPTQRMTNSADQLNAGDLCVVSVNEMRVWEEPGAHWLPTVSS